MCGIVGYVGSRNPTDVITSGLQRLEYRGYDSAGLAVMSGVTIDRRRTIGKISNLVRLVREAPLTGECGIGHTRWATHGQVSEYNAHPHMDERHGIVVVQNGIIENFLELKSWLQSLGHVFTTDTDTEVIVHLIGHHLDTTQSFRQALCIAVSQLKGGNAIVAMCATEPETIFVTKIGNAGGIVIGLGEDETFVASDVTAILDYTQEIVVLEDGQIAIIKRDTLEVLNLKGDSIAFAVETVEWNPVSAERGRFQHFMLKEIHDQPAAMIDALRGRVDIEGGRVILDGLTLEAAQLERVKRVYLVACGTSRHAALIAKYWIELLAGIPVEVDHSSEFRYREPLLEPDALMIAITQSGETADTLGAMEVANAEGIPCVAIVNAVRSQATRMADAGVLYLHAGPEISVASTKAFTSTLTVLYLVTLQLAQARRRMSSMEVRSHLNELVKLPGKIEQVLSRASAFQELAYQYRFARDMVFVGRGIHYPLALEGALKMTEISYLHAQGYPGGELKHGPIAIIDSEVPVVCLALADELYDKTASNIEQIRARHGRVIAVVTEGEVRVRRFAETVIEIPETLPLLAPILAAVPLQLLAYYVALARGHDIDQPRNLAKSVTVE